MNLCVSQYTQYMPLVHAHTHRVRHELKSGISGLLYFVLFEEKTNCCLLLMITRSYGNVYTMPFYHQVTRKKNNQAMINLHPLLIPKTISIGLKYCQVYSDDGIGL